MHGIKKKCSGFWRGNVKEGQHLEELDVGGRKMLKWILKKLDGDVDWIHLAQEMDSC